MSSHALEKAWRVSELSTGTQRQRCGLKDLKAQTIIEGSSGPKVPTIWTDEKHSQEEAELGRNSDVEKVKREKIRDGES